MSLAIQTTGLTKTFTPTKGWFQRGNQQTKMAVRGVDLAVAEGELFGLLGPNGAGKTTLVKMLCTLIAPTEGSGSVAGYDLNQQALIRRSVGLVVTDERSFYWRLSGRRNLTFFAAMHGLYNQAAVERVNFALDAVDLTADADRWFNTYSTGMKQRLAIARGLLHQPAVLFLDEPTRSLDPSSTVKLHNLIQRLQREQNLTVFLITHDLAEAEKLCSRVAVMDKGRIQVVGDPAGLRNQLNPQLNYVLQFDQLSNAFCAQLAQLDSTIRWNQQAATVSLTAGERAPLLAQLLELGRTHELTILNIQGTPPTLEEVFTHFTADQDATR